MATDPMTAPARTMDAPYYVNQDAPESKDVEAELPWGLLRRFHKAFREWCEDQKIELSFESMYARHLRFGRVVLTSPQPEPEPFETHTPAPEVTAAEQRLARLRARAAEQADDPGLWFEAETAPEAYLQAALRRLHEAIEEKP